MSTELQDWTRHFMWRRLFDGKKGLNAGSSARDVYAKTHGYVLAKDVPSQPSDQYDAETFLALCRENGLTIHPDNVEETFDIYMQKEEKDMSESYECCAAETPQTPKRPGRKVSPPVTSPWTVKTLTVDGSEYFTARISAISGKTITLDYCDECDGPCQAEEVYMNDCYKYQPNKKENNMGYEIETEQRRHLQNRLQNASWAKESDLTKKFHMGPVTIKDKDDLIKAMTDGRLQVREDMFDESGKLGGWNCANDYLTFKDPARDAVGYKAAIALRDKAYTAAKDKIVILPLEKGLEALNEFEAATF